MSEEKLPPARNEKGQMLPGRQSLNPLGRTPGFSIRERVRKHLAESPEDTRKFIQELLAKNKELVWTMLEGRPHQSQEVEHKFPQNLTELFNGIAQPPTNQEPTGEDTQ